MGIAQDHAQCCAVFDSLGTINSLDESPTGGELAALPADALVTSFGLGADECFGYLLDHVETRDSAEARRIEASLERAERSDGPTTVREWAVAS